MVKKTQTTSAYYDRIMEEKLIEWIKEEKFNWVIKFVEDRPDLDFQTGKNRDSSWFSVYKGTSCVLKLEWSKSGKGPKISVAESYRELGGRFYELKTWENDKPDEMKRMFEKLLAEIENNNRFGRYYVNKKGEKKEGYYQTLVSRRYTLRCEADDDLLIFDKEFIISYINKRKQKIWQRGAKRWTNKKKKGIKRELGRDCVKKIENPGDEIDFVGINKKGDLILLELKRKEDTSKIYLSPLQVGKYDELVRKLLNEQKEDFEKTVFNMIEQKKKLGILRPKWEIPDKLSGEVKLAVIVGGEASYEAKRRFCIVRDIVKKNISYYRCDPKGDGSLIEEDISVKKGRRDFLKEIYSKFFDYKKIFKDADVVCNNKDQTSYRFQEIDTEEREVTIGRVFKIQDKLKDIEEKFMGNANKDILTLHSSALLALLVFYKVNKDNPIVIERVKYNNVMFEVENEVVGGGPSRVDVLLISGDEKTLLFLESKFTEPLSGGIKSSLSKEYGKYYKKIKFDKIKGSDGGALECDPDPKKCSAPNDFTIKEKGTEKTDHFCEGIKQMISHFIGLCKGPTKRADKTYKDFFNNADKLILGEILFDFPDEPDYEGMQAKIDDYKTLYAGLAKTLNDNKEKFKDVPEIKNDKKRVKNIDKISVMEDVLTYQDLLDKNPNYKNNLDDRVKNFYQF